MAGVYTVWSFLRNPFNTILQALTSTHAQTEAHAPAGVELTINCSDGKLSLSTSSSLKTNKFLDKHDDLCDKHDVISRKIAPITSTELKPIYGFNTSS